MKANDLNAITVEVRIDDKPCDFSSLELRQAMNTHHLFSIGLNYRAKDQDLWKLTAPQILEYLGQSVSIHICERAGASIEFEGVINRIDIEGENSNQGVAILYGGSPTVLMTDDYSMAAFVETDLASIVDETIKNIGYKIEHKIEPLNNPEIPYICRYRESSYDFLNRLLASCGEWFYYDGKKIVVGFSAKQNEQEAVALSYKNDLKEMKISSTLGNYDIEQYDYDPTRDYISQWISPLDSENINKFTYKSFCGSKAIYKDYTILPSTIPVVHRTFNLMENSVNATHFGKLSEGALFRAKTSTCKTSLGSIISVESDPGMAKYTKELGVYRIIEVVHRYDPDKGAYENSVVGINADFNYIPAKGVIRPTAMPEVAKVVDNKDPRNLGRVKVQFVWQQLEDHPQGKTSGWMRVQTPDAGSSESVEKNRGFFFIPEVGDQVMVGYEYGDPNRPFVMGSLFHKNNTEGIAEKNAVRTLTTPVGSTLTFNDSAHTILLSTTKGNQLLIDEKNGTISITSTEEMNFSSKNIHIDASENITVNAGKDFSMTVGGESVVDIQGSHSVTVGKDMVSSIENDSTVNVSGKLQQKADDIMIDSTGGDITITSAGKALVQGAIDARISKG